MRVYKTYLFVFLAFSTGLGLALPACGGDSEPEVTEESGRPVTEGPFTQEASEVARPLDLLFVLDSSRSLADEREKLADSIELLISELKEASDFNVGFILGWFSETANEGYEGSGRFYQLPILRSEELGDGMADAIAAALRRQPPSDPEADGGEAGLFSTSQLFTTYRTDAQDAGFFRDEAALAAIFISDENDICAVYPSGVTPVEDPDGTEEASRAQYCDGITASSVWEQAQAAAGDSDNVILGGIVYIDEETIPDGGEDEIGYGYLEAIDLSRGVAADLAATDFNENARDLGNSINAVISDIQRVFVLQETPVNPLSIAVTVDGETVSHRFLPDTNEVVLSFAGQENSVVEIFYRVLD